MKRRFYTMIAALLFIMPSFSQSFIDRGYLNLGGPSYYWNDSYVIYSLTTSNEKGGKAKTTFEDGSYNNLLKLFEYDSKDWFALRNSSNSLRETKVGYFTYDYSSTFNLIYHLDDYLYFKNSVENENAISIIEEKCDLIKEQLISSYTSTKENFQRLSPEEKSTLRTENFDSSSHVNVEFTRYVDSRDGFFIFEIFQKELGETNRFRVYNYTTVYYDVVDGDHLKSFNSLDEKVLAICSELSINKEIVFGVRKEDVLKPYKDCGFILIRTPEK